MHFTAAIIWSYGCYHLVSVYFKEDAPEIGYNVFMTAQVDLSGGAWVILGLTLYLYPGQIRLDFSHLERLSDGHMGWQIRNPAHAKFLLGRGKEPVLL